MAKREYSNGLQHLKFMQSAKQREEAERKVEEDATVADESHWVVPANVRATGKRCSVILEGDPKPGALLGRMSFQNCNASIDKKQRHYTKEGSQQPKRTQKLLSLPTRSELVKDQNRSAVTAEEERTVQFKKPKVGAVNNLSASVGTTDWQSQSRNDNKIWQGWRSQGDYRMLRPPPKG